MHSRLETVGTVLIVLLLSSRAAWPARASPGAEMPRRYLTANGLTLLVVEDTGPRGHLALTMTYRAGSAHDPDGRSGTAHLLEHLTFHGTDEIGSRDWERERAVLAEIRVLSDAAEVERRKGESADFERLSSYLDELRRLRAEAQALAEPQGLREAYLRCGAQPSAAATARDFVQYYAILPVAALECVLRIEAARMDRAVLRAFYEEKEEILEELRRQRADPRVALLERALEVTLPRHPYARSNWGTAKEIGILAVGEVEQTYRRLYCPGNAVLSVVGDVPAAAVFALTSRSFRDIERCDRAPAPSPLLRLGPARFELDGGADLIGLAWLWPPRGDAEIPALHVLAAVLRERLSGSLPAGTRVEIQELAAGGEAGGLTLVFVETAASESGDLAPEIMAQVERLRSRGPAPGELRAARRSLSERMARLRSDPLRHARELAVLELQGGAADGLVNFEARLRRLDDRSLRRTAQRLLSPERLALITMTSGEGSR